MLKKIFILLFSCTLINTSFASIKNRAYNQMTSNKLNNQITKININTADSKTLQTIKGIGPKKAEAIINYRNKHGKFDNINELIKISQKGINQKWLDKIKPFIICK